MPVTMPALIVEPTLDWYYEGTASEISNELVLTSAAPNIPRMNLVMQKSQSEAAKKFGIVEIVIIKFDKRAALRRPQLVSSFEPIAPIVRPSTAIVDRIVLFLSASSPHLS